MSVARHGWSGTGQDLICRYNIYLDGHTMIQILVILICLAAIITALFSLLWGWIILAVPTTYILTTLLIVKQRKWPYIPDLSEEANQMIHKFGHFYAMPFAGRDFSCSASTLMFAGVAIAFIGVFKGFYWGIGMGIINWFVMGLVARAFNPTCFLGNSIEQMAHEEIISYIQDKQKDDTNDAQ